MSNFYDRFDAQLHHLCDLMYAIREVSSRGLLSSEVEVKEKIRLKLYMIVPTNIMTKLREDNIRNYCFSSKLGY